jgi:hypothetical protein
MPLPEQPLLSASHYHATPRPLIAMSERLEPAIPALARRQREGDFTAATRDRLLASMQRDIASFCVAELSSEVSVLACRLLMCNKLRASDALHLASALILSSRSELTVQFVAFDQALNQAACREGFELPLL